MKILEAYIYFFIIILVLNVKASDIYEYKFNRKIKRDDTIAVTSNSGEEVNSPTNNLTPSTPDETVPEPTKPTETIITTPSQEITTSTPTTLPEQEPDKTISPPSDQETKTSVNNSNNEDIKTKTDDTPNRTSSHESTNHSNSNSNNNYNNNNNNNSSNDNNSKTSNNNNNIKDSIDNSSNSSNTSSSNNNTSNAINAIKTSTNTLNQKNDKGGLSRGIAALIIVGVIIVWSVVILILIKLSKRPKSSEDYPNPVLNVDSSDHLNPQSKMSEDPMVESMYYNQNEATIPVARTIYGINENLQYYQSQQPQYDNVGIDISNQYQYQQDNYQNYRNSFVDDMRPNSINNGVMINDYPLPQQEVIQPIRNHSSLRHPTVTSDVPEVPLEDYNNPSMMNGEITNVGQISHKVIINRVNNIPIKPGTTHKAQFSFSPNMNDELRINSGDSIEIIEVYNDGWSYGKNIITNEVGVFPISFITGYNDPSNNF